VLHRTLTCAAVADLWNAYDEWAHTYMRAGDWAKAATNASEAEITHALRSCPSRQSGTVTALGKVGAPPQEVSTTAAKHLMRLTLSTTAKTVVKEAEGHAQKAHRSAAAAKAASKEARSIADRTTMIITRMLDLRTRGGLSLDQVRERHLVPGCCIATLGTDQDMWIGEIQERTTGQTEIKWITVDVLSIGGQPRARGKWSDWQPTPFTKISKRLIFDLDVGLIWTNDTEASLEWTQWKELESRWQWAKIRQTWDQTRPELRKKRAPLSSKKPRKKKKDDVLVPIGAFFRPREPHTSLAPVLPRPPETTQAQASHPTRQAHPPDDPAVFSMFANTRKRKRGKDEVEEEVASESKQPPAQVQMT
jgi:hypothetical protein